MSFRNFFYILYAFLSILSVIYHHLFQNIKSKGVLSWKIGQNHFCISQTPFFGRMVQGCHPQKIFRIIQAFQYPLSTISHHFLQENQFESVLHVGVFYQLIDTSSERGPRVSPSELFENPSCILTFLYQLFTIILEMSLVCYPGKFCYNYSCILINFISNN